MRVRESARQRTTSPALNDAIDNASAYYGIREYFDRYKFNNRKLPDGSTLIPWFRGKPMAWDVTVPDTYAESHIGDTATAAGAAANQAAANKIAKYDELACTHIFYPVAIETGGTWNHWAVELVQEIGREATLITGEPRNATFLFQQLSIALQRGNAVAFLNTFDSD